MKKTTVKTITHISFTIIILVLAFILSIGLENLLNNYTLVPVIFLLSVFVISLITKGYMYGIIASLVSVLAINYAFTFPFLKFNFTIPENLISAIIMIFVTIITSTLTTIIRRQNQIKAESEKERMRANLLRAVSHDLRTPLTTIYGSSSAMLDNLEAFSEEQKIQMLKGIKDDAQWLTRMVENLLSVTKLDGDNVKIRKVSTPLEELIDSVILKFKKRYPTVNVIIDIPSDFISIPMDPILIEQVIVNILENSVQHAKGMTFIKLRVFTVDKKAVFEISDDGCGIDVERLKTLFTGYLQSEREQSDKSKNFGIGLSVCSTIIKAHGGRIIAQNNIDKGALFRFYLEFEEDFDEQQV